MALASISFGTKAIDFLACASEQGAPRAVRIPVIEELTTPGVDGSNFRRVRYADAVWDFVGWTDCTDFDTALRKADIARAIDGNASTLTGTFGGAKFAHYTAVCQLISVRPMPGRCTGGGASGQAHLVTSWRVTFVGGA